MEKKDLLFTWLLGVSVSALVASNLLAIKLINIAGIPFDAGIILYPITYSVADLTVEFFGRKTANLVAIVSLVLDFAVTLGLALAIVLPFYPGWTGQESFAAVFGVAPRIMFASLAAYLASSLLNNYVFERIETDHHLFFSRAIGSSIVAKLVDTIIFETIAFLGVLSIKEFFTQMVMAYFAAIFLESILFMIVTQPVKCLISHHLSDTSPAP